jgi:hypothetical protein
MNSRDSGSNRHGLALVVAVIYLLLVVFSLVGIPGNPRGGGAWIPAFAILLTLPWIMIIGNIIPWAPYIAFATSAMINAGIAYCVLRIWRRPTARETDPLPQVWWRAAFNP